MFAGFLDLARKDVALKEDSAKELLRSIHSKFVKSYLVKTEENEYEHALAEFLQLSGVYWCVGALDLLGDFEGVDKRSIVEFIVAQQANCGGFSPAPGHDPHLLHTLCAVQVLLIFDSLDRIDAQNVATFVASLQNKDGSFRGEVASGEVDSRFAFVALATLHLIGRLDVIDLEGVRRFVMSCHNIDGGFGVRVGSESHSGQMYCCLGSLAILGRLEDIDRDKTATWLAERQCASGGLNGRPEKLPDVCYSWWVLASLAIIRRLDWIDADKLERFILAAQDEDGGIADRPGDKSDPFHTIFGLAGLSLLGRANLHEVDAVFCMTKKSLRDKALV